MSKGDRHRVSILWITFQLVLVLIVPHHHKAMALFAPYLSEFEYAPESHPSRNPNCPRRLARGSWDERRSPDEGSPVGQEPSIEIRAVLVRCPKSQEEMDDVPMTGSAYNITAGRSQDILEFHGFDRDEPAHHSEVRKCRRKLIVTMKFNNLGKTKTQEEFVVVDHVLDPVTMRKARLLNPYVFKVRQEQVLQLYGLKFQSVVNGEAREEVINNKWSNYTGCDDSLVNPTCGQMMFDGKPMPYSQGFCCSCDPEVNAARQPVPKSSSHLALGTYQKMIPSPTERQTPSREAVGFSAGLVNVPDEDLRTGLRNGQSLSKRDRSLKSSQFQNGLADDVDRHQTLGYNADKDHDFREGQYDVIRTFEGDKTNGIRLQDDYLKVNDPAESSHRVDLAERKTVLRENLQDEPPGARFRADVRDGVSNNRETLDDDIIEELKQSGRRKFQRYRPLDDKYPGKVPRQQNSDFNSELTELEKEYERLKESRIKVDERVVKGTKSRSKCRDFRKLARGDVNAVENGAPVFSQISETPNANSTLGDGRADVEGAEVGEGERNQLSSEETLPGGEIVGKLQSAVFEPERNNSLENGTQSVLSKNLSPGRDDAPGGELPHKIRTVFGNEIATAISDHSPSTNYPGNNTGPIILRQEMVDDNLYLPSQSEDNTHRKKDSSFESSLSKNSRSLKTSQERKYGESSDPRGSSSPNQYADWVIKYAKMHNNRYINSQLEAPFKSDADANVYPGDRTGPELLGWPPDTLSAIANKALKDFESVENELSSHHEGAGLDNSEIDETLESLQSPNFDSILAHDSEHGGHVFSSNDEVPSDIQRSKKLFKKSKYENSTDIPGSVKITTHSEDMVNGNYRYQDQSVTVIAEPHYAREQERIFSDESAAAKKEEESLKALKNRRERVKSEVGNSSRLHSLVKETSNADESMYEKFNRLDNLVRDRLRSRRRSFRSISYEDPFHQSNDEKQTKIDQQIEKEFAEISEALDESSDGKKNDAKQSSLQRDDPSKDVMARDLAVMLNKIPNVDVLKSGGGITDHALPLGTAGNGVEKLDRTGSAERGGHQSDRRRFRNPSRNIGSPGGGQPGSRRSSARVTAQRMLGKVPRLRDDGHLISGSLSLPDSGMAKAVTKSRDINKIVKEMMMRNDRRASPSWVRRQGYSGRRKNVAGFKLNKQSNRLSGSKFSQKSDLHNTHLARLQKKCHNSCNKALFDESDKDGEQSLPPEESTIATTRGIYELSSSSHSQTESVESLGSNGKSNNAEGSLPPKDTTTVRVTSSSTSTSVSTITTPSSENAADTVIPDEGTIATLITSATSTQTSTGVVNVAKSSNKLDGENLNDGAVSSEHLVIERSPIDSEDEPVTGFDATTFVQFEIEDSQSEKATDFTQVSENEGDDKAALEAENMELKKALEEVRKSCSGRTTIGDERRTDIMATTYSSDISTEEEDGDKSSTNNNEAVTAFMGTTTIQEQETTTKITAMTVYEPTTPNNDDDYTTAGDDSTMVDIEYDIESEHGSTIHPAAIKPPPLFGPKSFSDILRDHGKPKGSVPSRKTGKASVILIKAYSVSQNPREFFDNYEFPGGVKNVLLKKLNVTAFAPDPLDAVQVESLTRKIDGRGSKKPENKLGTDYVIPYADSEVHKVKSLKDDEEANKSVVDILSLLKNHNTVHESKIKDANSRVLGNTTFEYPDKIEHQSKNIVTDLDLMINELKDRRSGNARFNKKSQKNYHAKDPRSYTTVDTPPPDDDATHLGSKANNNAENFRLDSVMEQPIFVHQNIQRELDAPNDKTSIYEEIDGKNDKENSRDHNRHVNHDVVFFYDYDSDSDDVQADPKATRSQSVDQSRAKRNAGKGIGYRLGRKVVKLNDQVKRKRRRNVKPRHGILRKRDLKEYAKERGSAVMSRGGLGAALESKAKNITEKRLAEGEESSNGAQSPCRNGEDMVWQGKMDLLKLKKHQDILKEYLNWRPSVETTVMRIFSVQSTRRGSPTTESSFGKEQIPPQSSPTMSILLIEEEDENNKPPEGQQTTPRKNLFQKEATTVEIRQDNNGQFPTELETPAHHVTANTLDDKEILDKLSRMQPNDNLMVISVVEKNKTNDTSTSPQLVIGDQNRDLDRMKRKTGEKKRYHMRSIEAYGKGNKVGRQRRNANVRRGKTKSGGGGSNRHSGRRLMFADQLRENKEKGMSRAKEEIVENDELLPEYKDLVPMAADSNFDHPQDSSYEKHKRDKLKSNWDDLVDKIIVNSNNKNNDRIARSSVKQVEEIPSGNKRTAMEKLHFFDADKYINMIAKKISRLNNIEDTERDTSDERNTKVVRISGPKKRFLDNNGDTKIDANLNREFRDTRLHVETDDSAGIQEDEKNQGRGDDDGDDDDESSEYIEGPAVDDTYQNLESGADLLGFDEISTLQSSTGKKYVPSEYGEDIPYETRSSLVSNTPIGLNSFFDKLGSDFEISVSGKLHINGGLDDQPMSLSVEGMSLDNMSLGGNERHANDSWFSASSALSRLYPDGIAVSSENKKDTFFGEAGAVVSPNERTAFHPKRDFIVGEKEPNVSRNAPQVISDGMHPELSKEFHDDVSPRKTFYNVVVRAHPRYEKLSINGNRDPIDANEFSDRLIDGDEDANNDLEKITKNAAADEPVFDFAKLELRPPKPAAKKSHLRRRHGHRFRKGRATRQSETGAAAKLNKYLGHDTSQLDKSLQDIDGGNSSVSHIKLVKLIPVESFDENEEPDAILLPTKGSSDVDGQISRSNSTRGFSEFKQINNVGQTDVNMKYKGEAKTDSDDFQQLKNLHNPSEVFEKKQSKAYKSFSDAKHGAKITEPCFAKGEETVYMVDDPRNMTFRILNDSAGQIDSGKAASTRTNVKGVPGKERLSTDDLHLTSWQPSDDIGRKNGSGDTLLEGVKISAASENGHHLPGDVRESMNPVCNGKEGENCANSPQDERKSIELKNLMAMVSFIKKLENLLPGSNADSLVVDKRTEPEALVQVQSILLVPENSKDVELSEADQSENRKTTERVVEIGEGVRHYNGQLFSEKQKSSDPVTKSLTRAETALGNKYEEGSGDVEKNIAKDLADGIELQNKKSHENELRTELSSQAYQPGNDRIDASNNRHSMASLAPRQKDMDKSLKAHSNAVLNLMLKDRLEREGQALSSKEKSDNGKDGLDFVENGSHETALDNKRKEDAHDTEESEELFHRDKDASGVCHLLDKEGPVELKRNERWVVPSDRRTRTPVRYATGLSKMNAEELASVTNEDEREGVVEEKRRTQRLTGGKIVTKRRSKKHKHKKDKRKKKKKKNQKVEESSEKVAPSKTKSKWWPFKRSLLNIAEDQQLPKDIGSHRPAIKHDRNSISSAETERRTKKGRSKTRKKRQLQAGGVHIRGGQDCMDHHHPARVNPVKYQESAHCLRFSDLWYSVYELENPIMEHTVYLQLFEKHTLPDGSTHWDDLTQGSMVRLGTFVRHQRDSAPTITFTYSGAKIAPVKEAHNLDPEKDRLLVPSPVPEEKLSKYPEAKGGSSEYLVVQSSVINKDGNECDKGGVGFATFATQPNRCGQPKGTCLKNQPLAYWRHDVEARETGKPGCYFLSNFASVPSNPIKYNVSGTGSREYLGLEYHSPHVSAVDVEVRADYNAIVRVGSSGRVTEVHVDSTAPEHTVVTIVVSNMGLASSPYQSRISDCPTGLPVSWSKAKGAMQVIPPQHDQRVTLDLYGQLDVNGFHCSVEVVNHRGELVAMRRIRVQKMDRCFCVWHCLCACVGSVAGLGCQPMSTEHYHAAGFQGPVPVPSMESSVMMNTIKDVLILSALLVLLLLVLGMLKWFIGIFAPVVSRWGLDILLEGGCKIEGYFEPDLRCCSIVTDSEGRIVHPATGRRSVRICRRRTEFLLNLVFFLTWPVAVCHKRCRGSLAGRREKCYSDESKICLLKDEGEGDSCCGRKLISVNTYGDCRNSKMEDEDTRYVMNELKRSRDSLRDGGKRCKSCRSLTISQDYSSRNSCHTEQSAVEFVARLLNIRVVFRNLKHPVGGLNVPLGTPYSLRGYFMNAENGGYRFITPCPFKQHWLIDDGFNKKPLKPARTYPSNQFMRTFADAEEVLRSEEISLRPKGICLNVQFPGQD